MFSVKTVTLCFSEDNNIMFSMKAVTYCVLMKTVTYCVLMKTVTYCVFSEGSNIIIVF